MTTTIYKIENTENPTSADNESLARAGEIIRAGGLVAFPTETVYGLGASAYSSEAAGKVYAAKGRPSDNPLIVHVADPAEAERFAHITPVFRDLAERFMPGPITVIMQKRDCVPDGVTGGLDTVAIRCPSNRVASALIRHASVPVAAPSANLSGKPSPTVAAHVIDDLSGRVDMIIDGGDCTFGLESTVIKPESDGSLRLLRPGAVSAEMLRDAGYTVNVDPAVTDPAAAGDHPQSPGMKYKHYAPAAKLYLIDMSQTRRSYAEVVTEMERGKSGAFSVVAYDGDTDGFPEGCEVFPCGDKASSSEYAHGLFAYLRRADKDGCSRIYAPLPRKDGIGLAVYNRIIRASGGEIVRHL